MSKNYFILEHKFLNKKMLTVFDDVGVCDLSKINNHAMRVISSYQLIKGDLRLTIEQAKVAIEKKKIIDIDIKNGIMFGPLSENHIITLGLYNSCITRYAKCFTESKGRNVKLESKEVSKITPPEIFELHERLLHLRHNWTAHGGRTKKESQAELIIHNKRKSKTTSFTPLFLGTTEPLPEGNELEAIVYLCNKLIDYIDEKVKIKEKDFYQKNNMYEIIAKAERKKYAEIDTTETN